MTVAEFQTSPNRIPWPPLIYIAAFATQKLAIEREEQHLAARFGKKYLDYKKRVRRWI